MNTTDSYTTAYQQQPFFHSATHGTHPQTLGLQPSNAYYLGKSAQNIGSKLEKIVIRIEKSILGFNTLLSQEPGRQQLADRVKIAIISLKQTVADLSKLKKQDKSGKYLGQSTHLQSECNSLIKNLKEMKRLGAYQPLPSAQPDNKGSPLYDWALSIQEISRQFGKMVLSKGYEMAQTIYQATQFSTVMADCIVPTDGQEVLPQQPDFLSLQRSFSEAMVCFNEIQDDTEWMSEEELDSRFGEAFGYFAKAMDVYAKIDDDADARRQFGIDLCQQFFECTSSLSDDYINNYNKKAGYYLLWVIKQVVGKDVQIPNKELFQTTTIRNELSKFLPPVQTRGLCRIKYPNFLQLLMNLSYLRTLEPLRKELIEDQNYEIFKWFLKNQIAVNAVKHVNKGILFDKEGNNLLVRIYGGLYGVDDLCASDTSATK